MDPKHERVNELFNEWETCRAELRDQSQILQKAMRKYVDGKGPMPSEQAEQVHQLRKQCDTLFAQVVAAMKARAGGPDKP